MGENNSQTQTRWLAGVLQTLAVVICMTGVFISVQLVMEHFDSTRPLPWFGDVCRAGGEAGADSGCAAVSRNRWGYVPPLPEPDTRTRMDDPIPVFGVFALAPHPLSMYGGIYFAILGIWYLAVGQPRGKRRAWQLVPLLITLVGALISAFYLSLLLTGEAGGWCPWCIAIHVMNGALLLIAIGMWPWGDKRRLKEHGPQPVEQAEGVEVADDLRPPRLPTGRRVASAIVGAAAATAALWLQTENLTTLQEWNRTDQKLAAVQLDLDRLLMDPQHVMSIFRANPEEDVPVEEDDPKLNPDGEGAQLVVFVSYRCPYCERFLTYVRERLLPLFEGRLLVAIKHYEVAEQCREAPFELEDGLPPTPCRGAAAAEAARTIGGDELYWRALEVILSKQDAYDQPAAFQEIAESLGLNAGEFVQTMASDGVAERIARDIRLAQKLKIEGTPAPFLDGRLVPSLIREQPVFWDDVNRKLLKAGGDQGHDHGPDHDH